MYSNSNLIDSIAVLRATNSNTVRMIQKMLMGMTANGSGSWIC